MNLDGLQTASMIQLKRECRLALPGQVLVKWGDKVHPQDIIAEASIASHLLVLDIAKGLAVDPDEVTGCLVRQMGEDLEEGDVLAQWERAIPRLVRAPAAGKLIACLEGKAFLSTGKTIVPLQAGMIGVVEEIIPEFGVVLKTEGSLLQGMWGNGRVGSGILMIKTPPGDASQDASDSHVHQQGLIIAAKHCLNEGQLELLLEGEVKGLILCSLEAELVPIVNALPVPVIVLQGFGDLPPDPFRWELLTSCTGLEACINGLPADPFSGHRPEVIIPREEGEPTTALGFRAQLTIGQRVQINSGEHWGKTGMLEELPETPRRLESGLIAPAAVVRVDNSEFITTARQNLVIIN